MSITIFPTHVHYFTDSSQVAIGNSDYILVVCTHFAFGFISDSSAIKHEVHLKEGSLPKILVWLRIPESNVLGNFERSHERCIIFSGQVLVNLIFPVLSFQMVCHSMMS